MSNISEKITDRASKFNWPLYGKIAFILFLMLLLMIPNGMIKSLIHERSGLQYQVQEEIASTWGHAQTVTGPIIKVPYTTYYTDPATKASSVYLHELFFTPDKVTMDNDVVTEERQKGIYKTTLYTSTNDITASFEVPDKSIFGNSVSTIDWHAAELIIPITEPNKIISSVIVDVNGEQVKMGSALIDHLGNVLKASIDIVDKSKVDISTEIQFRGSQRLDFIPTGGDHDINITADWPSPGFQGSMLPTSREISSEGFSASWSANEYNRPMPDVWKDGEYRLQGGVSQAFGVQLIQTVDHYQKNLRSIKYALLIISLSFLIFFFFEMLNGSKINPFQYILIGLALSLFYLLLLSFTEHIGFDSAYIVASAATILMVSFYSLTVVKEKRMSVVLGGTLVLLYGYVYALLQMEDYALLVGSIGLFLILATVMYISRKIDFLR